MTDRGDRRQWAWREIDGETVNGPFESREEAIDEAKEGVDRGPGARFLVGRCSWLSAREYAVYLADAADLLERMNNLAHDNGEGPEDDEAFEICSQKKFEQATRELEKLLGDWAEKWVEAASYFVMKDEEEIKIEE
jgi:hypothetical protein